MIKPNEDSHPDAEEVESSEGLRLPRHRDPLGPGFYPVEQHAANPPKQPPGERDVIGYQPREAQK